MMIFINGNDLLFCVNRKMTRSALLYKLHDFLKGDKKLKLTVLYDVGYSGEVPFKIKNPIGLHVEEFLL